MSTTQVITGGLIAVGLTEGVRGVNWWAVLRVRTCCLCSASAEMLMFCER